MRKFLGIVAVFGIGCLFATSIRARQVEVGTPRLSDGEHWTTLRFDARPATDLPAGFESATYWDLRPFAESSQSVQWKVQRPTDAGLADRAEMLGAGLAVCAQETSTRRRLGCRLVQPTATLPAALYPLWSDLPGEPHGTPLDPAKTLAIESGTSFTHRVQGADSKQLHLPTEAIAEGLLLVPAGPFEVVLLRESLIEGNESRRRYRFVDTSGHVVAWFEGPIQSPFVPERGEILAGAGTRANDGVNIEYQKLADALDPGATGFLQRSVLTDITLSSLDASWTSVAEMVSIDATGQTYQPDPDDPGSLQNLPEVWDFTGLNTTTLDSRTFYTTRSDTGWSGCLESCSPFDGGPNPPDDSWQSYLKIDRYAADQSQFTRDIFLLNLNDTGANPSIDVPYVAQDELNTSDRSQICFADSLPSGAEYLHFFQFTGASPATATMTFGDAWDSGAWTSCNDSSGLRITIASSCGDACYPTCGGLADPRARGRLSGGAGFHTEIIEDGWIEMPTGNFLPSLLMRQDTDLEAGANFLGTCNISSTRLRAFDYFWLNEDYGFIALVSSPSNDTMPGDDWSSIGNLSDGADFTAGPFPPQQTQAQACLSGARISWTLPADGSNLNVEPNIADYGYVVAWGNQTDPEQLADWATNPNHTPLPGAAGYLAAPSGSEPTSAIITGWAGSSLNATVVTALRYTDPDVADVRTYRSAAFYKVQQATLDPGLFQVGDGVAPFSTRSGSDIALDWPSVSDAGSYLVRVWDLNTKTEIPCPGGMNCTPLTPSTIHPGADTDGNSYGYRAYAVDPCTNPSAN